MNTFEAAQRNHLIEIFKDKLINDHSIKTIKDFVKKYYKHERLGARGEDYENTVIKSHEETLEEHGIDWIGKYESVTGQAVAWRPSK